MPNQNRERERAVSDERHWPDTRHNQHRSLTVAVLNTLSSPAGAVTDPIAR